MVEYNKLNLKLTNAQLKKLKAATKNKTGTTLRMILRMIGGDNLPHVLPHVLFLTTRQKIKLKKAFNNNISIGIKRSKAQISKMIQSGGLLGALLSKLAGLLMKVAAPLAKKYFSSIFSN